MTSLSLSPEDKLAVFREATRAFASWYADDISRGMTDEELRYALERALGIFGGSSRPGNIGTSFKGAGLKIWAGMSLRDRPLFAGAATVAMARTVYAIPNPADRQLSLF